MDQYIQPVTVDGVNLNLCSLCQNFTHKGRFQLRNHVESVHFKGVFAYPCTKCEQVLSSKKALENHMYRKHRQLETLNNLEYPLQVIQYKSSYHEYKSSVQFFCSFKFFYFGLIFVFIVGPLERRDLDKYISTFPSTDGYRLHACTICTQFMHKTKYNVRCHLESKHFPNTQQYTCTICLKAIGTRKAYDGHMYRYHKNKQFC